MKTPELKVITKEELQSSSLEDSHASCAFCGSGNVYGISRVVGYYSPINNWNISKQAEFEARQKGDYKI